MKTKPLCWPILLFTWLCSGFEPVTAQCYEIYGLSPNGGESGSGAIYRTDESGSVSLAADLLRFEGYWPYGDLCQASNGKLYGMTSGGGKYNTGVLFEWDPVTGEYSKIIDFDGNTMGSYPHGAVIEATNGKLYGMTTAGGENNMGVIFEWDPATNIGIKRFDFNGEESGGKPRGSLLQASGGLIYGMTQKGGAVDQGVLFEWDPVTGSFAKILDFSGEENGCQPNGTLIQADNGKIYGMTEFGGVCNLGVLFELDPATNSFCKRIDFCGPERGSHPKGSLVEAGNGKLYGMTFDGGVLDKGVLFEWDPTQNIFTKKLDFDGPGNGGYPHGSLIEMENGHLAGIGGALFEWDPVTGNYFKKHVFSGQDGQEPYGTPILAENGKLYGMTRNGGVPSLVNNSSFGVLYEWDTSTESYSAKFRFLDALNGREPVDLVASDNGKLYGTARYGGTENCGVLFELDLVTDTYTKKLDFAGNEKGVMPGSVIQGKNGMLYGITNGHPEYTEAWTLFEWDPETGIFTQHFSFENEIGKQNGRFPSDHLIQADNDRIYGTTASGGEDDSGILFEWDPVAHGFTKKMDFDREETGRSPHLLVKANNGKIYGSAVYGSMNYNGLLFEWDPSTDTFVKKLDFPDSVYVSTLVQALNDKFYGVTRKGDESWLFEWDAETNAYTVKLAFSDIENGSYPMGDLTLEENGKLLGIICLNEENKHYAYFEWDPMNDGYEKQFDLNWTFGGEISGNFVLLKRFITGTLNAVSCDNFISPSGKYTWTTSGEYQDTISSAAGCDSVITVYLTIVSADTSITQHPEYLTANATDATFQWIDCDNGYVHVDGENAPTFTPDRDGHYAVIVSQQGCTDTSACYAVTRSGLETIPFKQSIMLYPNPTDGLFYIDMGRVYQHAEITIAEMDGRIIQQEQAFNSRIINMQLSVSPGMYTVTIVADHEQAVHKILKN